MYYLILIILLFGLFIELSNHNSKILYFTCFVILTYMLCFRYGQGTDYYAYFLQYEYVPNNIGDLLSNLNYMHGEFGWYLIMYLFKKISLNYEFFIIIISLVMMFNLNKAINKFSKYKICSLLLAFPTYYMTYFCSALRQGLMLSIFLGVGISLLLENKKAKYIFLILALSLLHRSAIILLILPFVNLDKIPKNKIKLLFIALIIFVLGYTNMLSFITKYIFGIDQYLRVSIGINAILIRCLYYFIINQLHSKVVSDNNDLEIKLYNIYTLGFYIFLSLSFSMLISQRLTVPIKSIEIILIPLQIYLLINGKEKHPVLKSSSGVNKKLIFDKKSLITIYSIVLLFVPAFEFYKNINSYIEQGNYYNNVKFYNYPYISIWNKNDANKYIRYFDEQFE